MFLKKIREIDITRIRIQQIFLIVLAAVISMHIILKSRVDSVKSAAVAFAVPLPDSLPRVLVSVSGDIKYPGVYEVFANKLTVDVINMADAGESIKNIGLHETASLVVADGADYHIKRDSGGNALISVGSISTGERMILGIPLDINIMNEADFERLPGVGSVMARRIVEYRHKNGGKIKAKELLDIDGIGEIKYQKLRKYF